MKRKLAAIITAGFMAISLAACGGTQSAESTQSSGTGDSQKLVIYSPASTELVTPLVNEFEQETNIKVEVIAAGTGELLKRVESEKDNPLGDVFLTGTISTVKPQKDLFEDYKTANENDVQDDLKNVEGCFTRFTEMPSVLMVNEDLIGDVQINGYEDLLNPALKGKIALADPSKSSSSFEHIVNMLYAMGNGDPQAGWSYVEKLCQNLDGKLLNGSSAVVKGVADGEYTVGLSNEADAAKFMKDGAHVKIVYMSEGVIMKPDGVYIIKGAKNLENAKKFLDFVTTKEAQTTVVEKAYRRSVRKDVEEPEGFISKKDMNIIKDDEEVVTQNKADWLNKFHDIFTSF